MGHFDWPFTKTSNICNAPQIKAFTINKEVRKCFSLPYIYPIQAQTFGQRIWDKLSLLHIVPFCEGPNQKSEGFAKEKKKT
jgi:hypothetical protein